MMTGKVLIVVYCVVALSIARCASLSVYPIDPCFSCRFKPSCPYGPELDNQGCVTCNCYDPCKDHICPNNEVCIREELICANPPCGIKRKCVCNLKCPYGYETDCSGCQTCKCIDPCQDVVCPIAQYCAIEYTNCTKISCFPTPVCKIREFPVLLEK
ncbi:hypothetical protein PPYR_11898 [Photinus pyralis]|uniref:Antistasin-like domain-containing protein n=1 Tax=Photinus pyralis TaxID=7054 RepID=A0A5N4ACP7_PHOPY|nr:cysteine-rich motor neuron 1 protein-like [Photinus pyralis]KAB0795059.1 hypothetical protein PPYR_11898 [Photinus pyralis]